MTHPTVPSCHWCDPNHAPLPETAFTCRKCGFEAEPATIHDIRSAQLEFNRPEPLFDVLDQTGQGSRNDRRPSVRPGHIRGRNA